MQVEKYFEEGPKQDENSWADMTKFSSDRGQREVQELVIYTHKLTGKVMARIFGGNASSKNTWASTDLFDSADEAVAAAIAKAEQFLVAVEDLDEYRQREPSQLWHGYD